jgi:NodT family efflux transporter outer membrane factor (OMF) lipoprotein
MLVGVNYQAPETVVPDFWYHSLTGDLHSGHPSIEAWWEKFDDRTLNRLIDRARTANPDLKIAYERITEARAARAVARSQLFPSVNAGGEAVRTRASESLLVTPPDSPNNPTDYWATGFDAGWEIDFFGGVRRSIESAAASAEAVEEAWRDATVALLAEVALNYVEYRTLGERIRLAESNIGNQRESVKLTRDRLEAGLAPELDVSQADTNLATSEALVPLLRAQQTLAKNRLSTLVGGFPGSIDSWLGTGGGIPAPRRSAGIGIPADLVRARPDIRQAERQLAAQTAQIGVAQADLLPRFTLAGTFELQALEPGKMFDSQSRAYAFGPSFRWNIFSGGRIKANIAIEESRTKQAYLAYESTVLKAVEEVESSLASIANERDRLSSLDRAVESARKTVSLVKDNYREGLVDFQNVLDAERTIFSAEDEAAVSRGQIATGHVSLFKALGGGTRMKPDAKPVPDKS